MMHADLPPVRQERDQIEGLLVFGMIMGAVAFAALCVFVMWFIWRANSLYFNPNALRRVEIVVREPVIGGVLQTLIDYDTTTLVRDRSRLEEIETLRWIDEAAGTAQIPIDLAVRALTTETTEALAAIAGVERRGVGPGEGGEEGVIVR